jgi:predicted outer membrane protein
MLGLKRLGLLAALVVVGLAPATAAQAAQPSTQDTQYLQALHQVNLAEIVMGNLAQQKGQNQQVKDLGKQFVTDHTQLDQTVQSTAQQLNVKLPSEPTADQQRVIDRLNNLSGAEFDKAWVTAELAGHIQAIQATQTEISQGSEQSVVQLAQDALPVLQAHVDALTALAQTLGVPIPQTSASGTPSPGGSGTPGPGGSGTPGPSGTESPAPGGTTTESPAPGTTETPAPGIS